MSDRAIFLSGLSYELGDRCEIGELDELKGRALLETFSALGLSSYRRCSSTPAALAALSLRRTLASVELDPGQIQTLVYATSSFWNERFYNKDINDLLNELQLTSAYPIGVTLSQCGNAIVALRIAASLLRAEEASNVLVSTVDTIAPGKPRIVPPDVSVASDASASFLVSPDRGEYEVLAVHSHRLTLRYSQYAYEDFSQYLRVSAQGLSDIAALTLRKIGKTPADLRWLFANNYNRSVARFFSTQTGFPLEKVYGRALSDSAHTFAADALINLHHCKASGDLARGDLVMLLASGFNMWTAAVLRKS